MNIFALARNPWLAAQLHCDAHVVKMILETAQLLSTYLATLDAVPHLGYHADGTAVQIYKPTHHNHPCALWLHGGRSHFAWLLQLGLALCERYTAIYGKHHKTETLLLGMLWFVYDRTLPDDCDAATWLQRLVDRGVKANVVRACAAKVCTTNPPLGCAFGVACMADDTVPLECDAHGNADLVATYLRYYEHKFFVALKMRWQKQCMPPAELKAAWGWDACVADAVML